MSGAPPSVYSEEAPFPIEDEADDRPFLVSTPDESLSSPDASANPENGFQKGPENVQVEPPRPLTGLKRDSLGFWSLLAFSISMICPTTSVLLLSGLIASEAGISAPFIIVLSVFMNLALANTVREFTKYCPSAGSFYTFVTVGLGTEWGFLCAWALLFGYGVLNIQVILELGAWASDIIWANSEQTVYIPWYVIGIIEVAIIATLAWYGISQSVKVSLVLVSLETIVVLIFCFAIIGAGGADGHAQPIAFTPFGSPNGVSGIFKGLLYGILVFLGFDSASTLSEEASNAKKTVGNAIVGSLLITAAYLCLGCYAMVLAVGRSGAMELANMSSAADTFARKFIGPAFAIFIDLAGMSAQYNVTCANFNTNYRILYSLGREKLLGMDKLGFDKTDPKRQTPSRAIWIFSTFCYLCALAIVAFCGGFASDLRTGPAWQGYNALSFIATLEILLVYIGCNVALYVYMKKEHPQEYRPWRHCYLPAFTFCIFLVPLFGNFIPTWPVPPYDGLTYAWFFYNVIGVALVKYLKKYQPQSLQSMGKIFG